MSPGGALVETVRIPADGVRLVGDLATLGAQVIASSASSSGVRRSTSSVARPADRRTSATWRLRGLRRLLPEPWAKTIVPSAGQLRFDIRFLVARLVDVVEWTRSPSPEALPIGLFEASTGAAVALAVAALRPEIVDVVVSRGGRPDLVADPLGKVHAPTLFIVGGDHGPVIRLNEVACNRLRCHRELRIVPGATHLFEEPGALDTVAALARDWFLRHLEAWATPTKEA